MQLIDFFDRGAELYPDRICVKDSANELSLSYAQVRTLGFRLANALRAAGVERGGRIAIISPNVPLAWCVVLGIVRAECVWLPVHTRNALDQNADFLCDNECAVVFFHEDHANDAVALRERVPGIRHLVCLNRDVAAGPGLERFMGELPAGGAAFPGQGADSDVVIIKGTGGTTGKPKSVMITHRNMATLIANFLALMHYDAPPVYLMAVPLTHGAGNIGFALLALGVTIVMLDRADPRRILECLDVERITTIFLPPTVIYSLLARPDVGARDYSALRHFIYSAAPMSVEKVNEALAVFGPVMTQAYGQTEAPLLCTFLGPDEHFLPDETAMRRRLLSCGRRTPFTRVEVMDNLGNLLGPNELGEIVVRGDLVMKGYFNNPEENAAVSKFGWHHTGDVGLRDEGGYFYILDRKKDMIISGGFNIYPSEIEQVLWTHPAVQDCAVIGVPHEKWGEAVTAVVELKPGASVSPENLSDFCRERLGGMKTPKSIEFWAELPRSTVGKVLKREIRDRYWQGRERQV